ncbi:Serine/threonine kinase [Chytriomyces hyalinus]|nr:Serine/threonine kinase [Chytriomyces hyalinus]
MNRLGFFARRFNSVARTFTENSPASFPSVKETMAPHAYQEYQHAYKSTNTWFYLNFAITIPGLAAALYFCVPPELEHLDHLLEHPREFEDLPYMRKRKTPFPWGDNSLFHNDHANPSKPLPHGQLNSQIADISFKIETERRVLQGAKLMYGQLRGAAEKEACEANMFETSRRIEYFEGLLQEAYAHQNGEAPPPQSAKRGKQDFPRRLSSLPESQHNQNTAAADGNLGYAQRGVLSFFGLSKRASSASLNSITFLADTVQEVFIFAAPDLVKYGLAITPSRVQGRLQDVLYKLDMEYRIKSDTENLLRVRMNDGANDVRIQAGLKAKLTEGGAKIALLERAKRRYVALDVAPLALRTDENRVKETRRKCSGRLRLKLIGASNLMGRNSFSGHEIIATVLLDGKLVHTTLASTSRWDEVVQLQIESGSDVEISIFSVPQLALLGMQWFTLHDLENETNVLYPNGAPSNVNDAAEVWMDVEPAGQLLVKPLFDAFRADGAHEGLYRRAAIQKSYPRNGHRFYATNSLILQCAVCNELSSMEKFYQCRGCDYVCHVKCFSNVITKCITHEDMQTAKPGADLNTGQLLPYRIKHRFQPKTTTLIPSWCGHCGSIMGPAVRFEKCTECGKCAHGQCKPMIPNFCGLKPDVALQLTDALEDASRRMRQKRIEETERAERARQGNSKTGEASVSMGMPTPPNEHSKIEEERKVQLLQQEQKLNQDKERESIDAALHEAELERRRSELQREQEMKAQHFAAAAAAAAMVAKPEPILRPSNYPPNVQVSIPKVLQKNTTIEDFEMLSVLGRGGYGKVMLVEEKSTKKLYAMKAIKKDQIIGSNDANALKLEKRIFQLASQSQHPYLVNMHSCFQSDTRVYFVMEYISGGDLMCHIMVKRNFSQARVQFYACEIILAIEFLHRNNVIYRDLKLENVLMCADGHIKVADYGICKENLPFGKYTNTLCGTTDYMAPEILSQNDHNRSADWWSFGVLLFTMLRGKYPFSGSDEDEMLHNIRNTVLEFPADLPKETASLIKGLLTIDQTRRLGGGVMGAQEIKRHPYFKGINWAAFEKRQKAPIWRPSMKNEKDVSNFDPEFTNEPVMLTPLHSVLSAVQQAEFTDFDYTASWAGVPK